MSKPPTGEKIVMKVGALADQSVRAVPLTLENVIGTSTGYSLSESEVDTMEFGTGASQFWEDGAVVSRGWTMDLDTNYRPGDSGNVLLEETAFTSDEIYVAIYPFGEVTGEPYYYGYATVNGFSASFPRDGALTASGTLQGRGVLTKGSVV